MLEELEMRFILTDIDGKVLGCYSELESAEMDAKDTVETKGSETKLNIYELITSQKIGEPYLQNIYELRMSLPEAEKSEETTEE
jgi:hypothetical protein